MFKILNFLFLFYLLVSSFILFSYYNSWDLLIIENYLKNNLLENHSWLTSLLDSEVLLSIFMFIFITFLCLNIITSNNSVTSLLYLILVYFFSGFALILHKLEFFGLLYIIIYVGAIAVLFLFVIMMLKFEKWKKNSLEEKYKTEYKYLILFFFSYLFIFFISFVNTWQTDHLSFYRAFNKNIVNQHELEDVLKLTFNFSRDLYDLGFNFYTNYFYIFLMSGVILLLSIIAPIVLTFKKPYSSKINSQNPSIQLKRTKSNSIVLKDLRK